MSDISIEYGTAVAIFGTGWKAERFPTDKLPAEWWERTDFAWRCDACPTKAGVMYTTIEQSERAARQHAARHHPGATVEHIRQPTS